MSRVPQGLFPPSSSVLLHKGTGTELKMVHSKVPAEQVEYYAKGWKEHYWEPLKKYFDETPRRAGK